MQTQDLTQGQAFGQSISPHAVGTLTAKTRWLISAGVRAGYIKGDTGREHGPEVSTGMALARSFEGLPCGIIR